MPVITSKLMLKDCCQYSYNETINMFELRIHIRGFVVINDILYFIEVNNDYYTSELFKYDPTTDSVIE